MRALPSPLLSRAILAKVASAFPPHQPHTDETAARLIGTTIQELLNEVVFAYSFRVSGSVAACFRVVLASCPWHPYDDSLRGVRV